MLAYELSAYSGDDDKTALLDALKEEMECEFTIFHGDERAYTTIQQNGQRAVGYPAAVEAARAGMAGKGFAVVVDEVCSLAAKSAEASKSASAPRPMC